MRLCFVIFYSAITDVLSVDKLVDRLAGASLLHLTVLACRGLPPAVASRTPHAAVAFRTPLASYVRRSARPGPSTCAAPPGQPLRGSPSPWAGSWLGIHMEAMLIPPRTRTPAVWSMSAHGHGSTWTDTATMDTKGFVQEMKDVAMKLHTREQAPKGTAEQSSAPHKFEPTREGYLSFLVESKVVFDMLEGIMAEASQPSYVNFQNTGLERSASLEHDIAHLAKEYSLEVPVPSDDGPGRTYAELLRKLAADDPAAFMCHYYNQYFAHTAGGRMMGKKVYDMLFDGKLGAFYQYDGNMGESLQNVRRNIDATAEDWSREQKDHCLEETSKSFQYGGALLKCMMGSH